MDEQGLDDQLKTIYKSSVLVQDVACREKWTIETSGERGSGKSQLAIRHDDDDDKNLILRWDPNRLYSSRSEEAGE